MYLVGGGELLDLLVKNSLDALAHLGDEMVRAVKELGIAKDEAHIRDELVRRVVTRVRRVRVRLGWV